MPMPKTINLWIMISKKKHLFRRLEQKEAEHCEAVARTDLVDQLPPPTEVHHEHTVQTTSTR